MSCFDAFFIDTDNLEASNEGLDLNTFLYLPHVCGRPVAAFLARYSSTAALSSQMLKFFSVERTLDTQVASSSTSSCVLTKITEHDVFPSTSLVSLHSFHGISLGVFTNQFFEAYAGNDPSRKVFCVEFQQGNETCCVVPPKPPKDKPYVFVTGSSSGTVTWWSAATKIHSVSIGHPILRLMCDETNLVVFREKYFDLLGLFNGKSIVQHQPQASVTPESSHERTVVKASVYAGRLVQYHGKALRFTNLSNGQLCNVVGLGSRVLRGIHQVGNHVAVFYFCQSRGYSTCLYDRAGTRIVENVLPIRHTDCGDKIELPSNRSASIIASEYICVNYVPGRLYIDHIGLRLWSRELQHMFPPYAKNNVQMLLYHLCYRRQILLFDLFSGVMEFMFWVGMPEQVEEYLRPVVSGNIMDMTCALASNLHWKSSEGINPEASVEAAGLYISQEELNTEGPIQYVVAVHGTVELGVAPHNGIPILGGAQTKHLMEVENIHVNINWARGRLTLTDMNHKIRWSDKFAWKQDQKYYAACRLGYNSRCEIKQTLNNNYAAVMPCSCGKTGEHVVDPTADCYCLCGRIGNHVMQYITEPKCGTRGSCICGESKRHLPTNLCECECGRSGIHVLKDSCKAPMEGCICGVNTYHITRDKCECKCGRKGIHAIRKSTCGLIQWTVETHQTRPWPQLFFRIVTATLHCWNVLQQPTDNAVDVLEFFPWYTVDTELRAPYFGSCLCRSVTLIALKDPLRAYYDHHSARQRLYGAPFVTQYVFAKEDLSPHEGKQFMVRKPATVLGGANVVCSLCHASLFIEKGHLRYSTSSVFHFNAKDMPNCFKPKSHLYYEHAILNVQDALPKLDCMTRGFERLTADVEDEEIVSGIQGHCACGRVRVRVATVNASVLCKTEQWRRVCGSPLTWMLVVPTMMKHLTFEFSCPLATLKTSKWAQSCSACGSTLAVLATKKVIHIPMALFPAYLQRFPPQIVLDDNHEHGKPKHTPSISAVAQAHTTDFKVDLTRTEFALASTFAKTETARSSKPFTYVPPGTGRGAPPAPPVVPPRTILPRPPAKLSVVRPTVPLLPPTNDEEEESEDTEDSEEDTDEGNWSNDS